MRGRPPAPGDAPGRAARAHGRRRLQAPRTRAGRIAPDKGRVQGDERRPRKATRGARRLGSLVDAAQPRAAVLDSGSLAAPWGGGAPAWSWPWSGWPRPRGRLPRLRVAAAAPRRRTRSPRRRLRPLAAHETRRRRALTRVASPETLPREIDSNSRESFDFHLYPYLLLVPTRPRHAPHDHRAGPAGYRLLTSTAFDQHRLLTSTAF